MSFPIWDVIFVGRHDCDKACFDGRYEEIAVDARAEFRSRGRAGLMKKDLIRRDEVFGWDRAAVAREGAALQLLVKIASGTGNVNPTGRTALAVFHALHDAGWLRALGTIRALGGIHFLLAVAGFGNLGHVFLISFALEPPPRPT